MHSHRDLKVSIKPKALLEELLELRFIVNAALLFELDPGPLIGGGSLGILTDNGPRGLGEG